MSDEYTELERIAQFLKDTYFTDHRDYEKTLNELQELLLPRSHPRADPESAGTQTQLVEALEDVSNTLLIERMLTNLTLLSPIEK